MIMIGAEQTAHSLEQIRSRDHARELTRLDDSLAVGPLVEQGTVSLLNVTDSDSYDPKVTFLARTFLIAGLKSLQPAANQLQITTSLLKSSLLTGLMALNPQETVGSLPASATGSELQNHYESLEHQQMCGLMKQVAGEELLLATPQDFIEVARVSVGPGKYLSAISAMVNFALSCPQSCDYSAEEIFVASCLVTIEKSHIAQPMLQDWLNQFFLESKEKAYHLNEKLKAALLEFTGDSDDSDE